MIGRIFLAVFGVTVIAICHGKELNSNEAEARMFLNQTSENLFKFHDEMAYEAFTGYENSNRDEETKNFSTFYYKVFEDSRKFDVQNFKDEELKYAFKKLIEEVDTHAIGVEKSLELSDAITELDNLPKKAKINDFNDSSIALSYSPDVESKIDISNDPKELQYYWSAWRQKTGKWAEKNIDKLLQAIKKTADLTELSPLEYWSRGLNITDMEKLMSDIQPLYLELHAFVRQQLRKKYGESVIAPNGLIPNHLFSQIYRQIATNESIIDEMFPYESLPMADMDKYTPRYMYKIAEKFYEDLGFEKFPSSLWDDRSTVSNDDACRSKTWAWTPNVRIEYCEQMDFLDFLYTYSDMTYLHYAKEMVGLPGYFFNYPNRLGEATANAVILSSSTHHNLMAVGLIADYNSNQEVEMNRLLRKAMESLLYIPLDFVNAKLMTDLVTGNITKAEINNHYWQLMDKYAGMGPPKDHQSNTFDLPQEFYSKMNDNYMSSDFTLKILGYQIYKKLCELSGKYPKEPLHLCDINGSKEAGNALKTMMRFGASKPLNEVLASIFPENPSVAAEGLLEYYTPMRKLLAKKNKEANQKPGWKSSDK